MVKPNNCYECEYCVNGDFLMYKCALVENSDFEFINNERKAFCFFDQAEKEGALGQIALISAISRYELERE